MYGHRKVSLGEETNRNILKTMFFLDPLLPFGLERLYNSKIINMTWNNHTFITTWSAHSKFRVRSGVHIAMIKSFVFFLTITFSTFDAIGQWVIEVSDFFKCQLWIKCLFNVSRKCTPMSPYTVCPVASFAVRHWVVVDRHWKSAVDNSIHDQRKRRKQICIYYINTYTIHVYIVFIFYVHFFSVFGYLKSKFIALDCCFRPLPPIFEIAVEPRRDLRETMR